MLFDNDCPVLPPLPAPEYADIRVLLASASPRRRQLLGMIVPHFETVRLSDVKEEYPASLPPEEVPAFLSRLKADAYVDRLRDNDLMITADTIVIAAGIILGKPSGRNEAIEMLRLLSDSTHTVVTGVTLSSLSGKRSDTFSVSPACRRNASRITLTATAPSTRPEPTACRNGSELWEYQESKEASTT